MTTYVGPEEFGILRPTLLGGKPDRLEFYQDSRRNTLLQAEEDRRTWIMRGEEALVVSRQWVVV
jgi:hypothetical protein